METQYFHTDVLKFFEVFYPFYEGILEPSWRKLLCFAVIVLEGGLLVLGWKLSDSNRDLMALPLVLQRALVVPVCLSLIRHLWKYNKPIYVVASSLLTAAISIALLAVAGQGKLLVPAFPQCALCMIPLISKWFIYKHYATILERSP